VAASRSSSKPLNKDPLSRLFYTLLFINGWYYDYQGSVEKQSLFTQRKKGFIPAAFERWELGFLVSKDFYIDNFAVVSLCKEGLFGSVELPKL
jgi:hypothetical protein